MKKREDRRNVIIPARVRWEGRWLPATIRNISAHGMLLRLPQPPRSGTYVELEVGPVQVAARTVWSGDQCCGLHSRETFDLSALGAGRGGEAAVRVAQAPAARPQTYRRRPGLQEQAERSRTIGSVFQYLVFVVVIVTAAGGLAWEVFQTLSAPMQQVHSALDVKKSDDTNSGADQ